MTDKKEYLEQLRKSWNLTFYDDFTGDTIDGSKWSHCPEESRVNGACFWSDKEAFVDGNGHLVLQVSERDGKYYAGAIRSLGKFEQRYGLFEICCQIEKEEGFWCALWLFSQSVFTVTEDGKNGSEIDIMESAYKYRQEVSHTIHWNGYKEHHRQVPHTVRMPEIFEGYHTFSLEWNEKEYVFYIDGYETWRTDAGGVSQVPAYLKLSVEVGEWAGDIKKAALPDAAYIDEVWVYQKPENV